MSICTLITKAARSDNQSRWSLPMEMLGNKSGNDCRRLIVKQYLCRTRTHAKINVVIIPYPQNDQCIYWVSQKCGFPRNKIVATFRFRSRRNALFERNEAVGNFARCKLRAFRREKEEPRHDRAFSCRVDIILIRRESPKHFRADDLRLLTKRVSDEIPTETNSWAGRKCCVASGHPVLFKTIVESRRGGRASAERQNSGGTRQITSSYKIRPAGGLVARCILFS